MQKYFNQKRIEMCHKLMKRSFIKSKDIDFQSEKKQA